MRKLTLTAEPEVIRQAKRLAEKERTSVSAMFSSLVRSLARRGKVSEGIPRDSIAARATGYISLPRGKTPREVLTEALLEKYRSKR